MTDPGRQNGDCEHGKYPAECLRCLQARVDTLEVGLSEVLAGRICTSYGWNPDRQQHCYSAAWMSQTTSETTVWMPYIYETALEAVVALLAIGKQMTTGSGRST